MDENTIQAINDAYEKLKNAILEAYSAIVDAFSLVLNENAKIVRNARVFCRL